MPLLPFESSQCYIDITASKISYSLIKPQVIPCALVCGYKFHALSVNLHLTLTTSLIGEGIWNPTKHHWWGLFWKYSQPVEAVGYFRGEAPSWILDRILIATLPNNLFRLVHTNAGSLFPSITRGAQGLTHLLGRQSKQESQIVRCSSWPRALGFSRSNQHNLELTLPPLSLH